MFAMLIRIDAQDALGAAAPLYLASHDLPELCHLGTATWFPALSTLPELAYDFFGGAFTGEIAAPRTGFSVETGDIADFADRRHADARVRIWAGDLEGAPAGGTDPIGPLALWFDGRITAEPVVGEDRQAQFTAAVDDAWLDAPLLPLFAGTGGVEGPDDLTGQVKPLALGNLRFAGGVLIDRVENIWMVSHAGFDSAVAAYDRVVALGASQGDFADYSALAAADIAAGRWATSKAAGLIKLGAPPDGKVAFDVLGDNAGAGGTVRRAGAMIARLAQLAGGSVNAASLTALDAARPYNLALQLAAQTTARTVIQQIADSVAAVAGVSWTGELFVQSVGIGAPAATLAEDGTSAMAVIALEEREKAAPFWRIATEAEPTWVLFDQGEVALDFTWRGPWNALRVYRLDDLVTAPDGRAFTYINATPSAGNALPASGVASNAHWQEFSSAQANRATTFRTAPPATPPTLFLDLLRSESLDPRMTFSRASTATYWGSDGRLKTAAVNDPRFDHDPLTGEPLGLLLEPFATTNLLLHSAQFGDPFWGVVNITIAANTSDTPAPDGTDTAGKILETVTNSHHSLFPAASVSITAGTTYTASVWLKQLGNRYAQLVFDDTTTTNGAFANFDLLTGEVTLGGNYGAGANFNARAVLSSNGWCRIILTTTAGPSAVGARFSVNAILTGTDGLFVGHAGDTTKGFYIWGAQLEARSSATSYIPTTTAAVTRAADVASVAPANLSPALNAATGAVFAEFLPAGLTTSGMLVSLVSLDNGTENEFLRIREGTLISGIDLLVTTGGLIQADSPEFPLVVGQPTRMAFAYAANDFILAKDGALGAQDASGSVPPVDRIGLLGQGHYRDVRYYPARLPDAELQSLTAFPVAEAAGDVWVDASAGNRTMIADAALGWVLSRDGALGDAWNKLGPIEDNADVTKAVQGPAQIFVEYDYLGAVKSSLLPILKNFSLVAGGVVITSGVTWAVFTTSGTWSGAAPSISGTGIGQLSINSGPAGANNIVRVEATFGGRPYNFSPTVSQKLDDPPVVPPAGGTSANEAVSGSVPTSGAWIDITGVLSAFTGAGITNFDLTLANHSLDPQLVLGSTESTFNIQYQWLWRPVGGTFATVGAVADSNPDPAVVDEGGGFLNAIAGAITCNRQQTGLTGGTQYEFKAQARMSSGADSAVAVSGNASIEGGT